MSEEEIRHLKEECEYWENRCLWASALNAQLIRGEKVTEAGASDYIERLNKAEKERDQAMEALRKIYTYRSDKPDWNMVMAIAGDIVEPVEAIPSGGKTE
jgi:hypothetical protein